MVMEFTGTRTGMSDREIPFTQFLRPDGRQTAVTIERPAPIVALAAVVRTAGGRFEIEELQDRTVSMTVECDAPAFEDAPVTIKLCPNGPAVPETVDALVREAYARLVGPVPPEAQPVENSYVAPPYGYTLELVDGSYAVQWAHTNGGRGYQRKYFGIDLLGALDRFADVMTAPRCVECRAPVLAEYMEPIKREMIAQQVCFSCHFWRNRVGEFSPATVIVDGRHYQIEPDRPNVSSGSLGFGGGRFEIAFNDGRRVVTHNLWTQGEVPLHFRARLADNARFVERTKEPTR